MFLCWTFMKNIKWFNNLHFIQASWLTHSCKHLIFYILEYLQWSCTNVPFNIIIMYFSVKKAQSGPLESNHIFLWLTFIECTKWFNKFYQLLHTWSSSGLHSEFNFKEKHRQSCDILSSNLKELRPWHKFYLS